MPLYCRKAETHKKPRAETARGFGCAKESSGLLLVDQLADEHDDGEDDQIPEVLHLVADEAGVDHEQGAEDGEHRDHIAARGGLFLGGTHPVDEDGDVHGVDGDDGQLRGVEAEGHALEGGADEGMHAAPGLEEAGEHEVAAPEAAEQQAEDGGVVGQVGLLVDLIEQLGIRALASGGQGVDAAAAAEHQAVHGAGAGDRDEEVEDVAEDAAEDVDEGGGRAVGHQHVDGSAAGNADVVGDVGHDDDDAADDEGLGQVLLRVLELGIDGGGDDPALIGEGGRADGGEQGSCRAALGGGGGGEVADQHVVGADEADDDADDGHQEQGDELDDRGGGLEVAGELRGERVDDVGADEEEHGQDHALRPNDAAALRRGDQQGEVRPAGGHEDQRVARGEPGEDDGQRRVVDDGHEPADVVAVLRADERLGVVDDAVDLLVLLRHRGEGEDAEDHDQTADDPGEDAERHVALGLLKNGLRLEEDARADDDADDHADRGEQPVLSFEFGFHMCPPVRMIYKTANMNNVLTFLYYIPFRDGVQEVFCKVTGIGCRRGFARSG